MGVVLQRAVERIGFQDRDPDPRLDYSLKLLASLTSMLHFVIFTVRYFNADLLLADWIFPEAQNIALLSLSLSLYPLPGSFLPNRVAMEWVRGMQSLVRMMIGKDAMGTGRSMRSRQTHRITWSPGHLACTFWQMEPAHPISWICFSQVWS